MPDSELTPQQLSRRGLLRRAGLLGAGVASASVLGGTAAAAAAPHGSRPTVASGDRPRQLLWLAGDHHIHTLYSDDGMYRVDDQVRQGVRHGLDWMVITDHGGEQHARVGVERVNPEIVAARDTYPDSLVFQGLEWNVPAADHGTVFVHPGDDEVSVLKQFETDYDGAVRGAEAGTPENEALAIAGLDYLAEQLRSRRVRDVLMLANHPSRFGVDSPGELRGWRDAQPHIAVGMEAAPGHQAAGIPAPHGMGVSRGVYIFEPSEDSFPGYPEESYRTWGGYDFMTATVGGLWDSLLAEGKPWWVTANSDSHRIYLDVVRTPEDSDFAGNGYHDPPVYDGVPGLDRFVDYWPGQYSRTHVGAEDFSYAAVMEGIRQGRVWVDHGGLISGLDAWLEGGGQQVTLGGTLLVPRGTAVTLRMDVALANGPNWAGFVPTLARVDVIEGEVTGEASDRDVFHAPGTRVARSFEVNESTGGVRLVYELGRVETPRYVRLRGTDGNRGQVGYHGADVDPAGPALDVFGDADPWKDLWFYSNPIWVLPE